MLRFTRKQPNKRLQSEPNTFASSFGFGSVSCRLNRAVMLFAMGVMKAKPLYCNSLVIYKVVESG